MSSRNYVVIGGGTSGCIVAGKLSERYNIVLFERGKKPTDFHLTVNGFVNKRAITELHCKGDKIIIPNVFGGGSSVNGSVWIRSSAEQKTWLNTFDMEIEYDSLWNIIESTIPIVPSERNEAIELFANMMSLEFNVPVIQSSKYVTDGIFPIPLTRNGDCRVSSYTAFLEEKLSNLDIRSDCHVSHLEWRKENGLIKAVAIVCDKGRFDIDGEVILCAGAIGTPQILFKSNLHFEIPDIGSNLRDHPCLEFFTPCNAFTPAIYAMFFKSSEDEPYPDFQVQFGFAVPKDDCPVFFFQIAYLKSNSSGSLSPSSENQNFPNVLMPQITSDDKDKWDMVFLKLEKVFTHPLCSGWKEKLCKTNIHSYQHLVGTCQLGKVTEPGSFLLKGCTNIRLCDASIIPEPTLGNPQAFVYASAMKLVNLIQ